MAVFVLFMSFLLAWLCVYGRIIRQHPENSLLTSLRIAFLVSSTLWTVVLVVITDLLSLLDSLNYTWLLIIWTTVCILLLVYFAKQKFTLPSLGELRGTKTSVPQRLALIGVSFILITTLVIALVSPPNNWDSMTYHMARVEHWIQNQSVRHYSTHIERQLVYQPLAEFIILHLQVLSSSDRFANLVQWFSLLGSLVGVSMITKQFGGSVKSQIASVVIGATIPMAILQASSTQNDLVISFWLINFVFFLLSINKKPNRFYTIISGLALGLCLLTKGTAYIFAFPFVVWFVLSQARKGKNRFRGVVKRTLIIGLSAFIMNSAHYYRNISLYGHPLGMGRGDVSGLFNEIHGTPVLISNVTRNLALHLASRSYYGNRIIVKCLRWMHGLVGLGIDDPRTTSTDQGMFKLPNHFSRDEDTAQNFGHVMFIALAIGYFLTTAGLKRERNLLIFLSAIIFGFLIFCHFLKWQPYHSRLHTPLFLIMSPFCAIMLSKVSLRMQYFTLIPLFVYSLPIVFANESRPLLPIHESVIGRRREDIVFHDRPYLLIPYRESANFVKAGRYSKVGLLICDDDWEYPLWVLLKAERGDGLEIEHVNVSNVSSRLERHDFVPDCVLSTTNHKDRILISNQEYINVKSDTVVSFFVRKEKSNSFNNQRAR